MANLAIKGHPTRGKEVIEILEILGGCNKHNYTADCDSFCFYISTGINIIYYDWVNNCCEDKDILVFTLEEFLQKYPYMVGDKVIYHECEAVVTSMEWNGDEVCYTVLHKGIKWQTTVFYLQPYKEETMEEKIESIEILESRCADEVKIEFDPSKYEMVERKDGYYVVKKQPPYPKTFGECRAILGLTELEIIDDYRCGLLTQFRNLLICRDAYWKIAGEQMGLGKPWEPDFTNDDEERYGIYTVANKVVKDFCGVGDVNTILTFPTEEMRDAFKENFDDDIEFCKEFL